MSQSLMSYVYEVYDDPIHYDLFYANENENVMMVVKSKNKYLLFVIWRILFNFVFLRHTLFRLEAGALLSICRLSI